MSNIEEEAARLAEEVLAGKRSINTVMPPLNTGATTLGANPDIAMPRSSNTAPVPAAAGADVAPMDEHNKELVRHVGPRDRPNPEPSADYDLVVLGAGVAGLLSSITAKDLGKRVAMVEQHYMGGDCLNVGCFPSKVLIASAKRLHQIRTASALGVDVDVQSAKVDFPAVMERMRRLRAAIGPHDGVDRYQRDFNEHVFLGKASFTSKETVDVVGFDGSTRTLRFKKAMVATGGSAAIPPVPGLRDVPHLTNNTLFNLEALPGSMALIGAGPIGLEMAQTFARFGSKVVVLEVAPQLLPREDPDAAAVVKAALEAEPNLQIRTGVKVLAVRHQPAGPEKDVRTKPTGEGQWDSYEVDVESAEGVKETLRLDALLNATGRVPNVSGIGLEAAGVEYDTRSGVHIDDHFQTTNPNIYACGDVASPFKFTHAADWQARTAVRNMFLCTRETQHNLLTPWCTFTDPEIAHVGKYEKELAAKEVPFTTYTRWLKDVDRCKCDGVETGFVKITVAKGTDKILGCTIVGPGAGDLISEVTVCMTNGVGLSTLAGTIHPYPTTGEALRQCAAIYWQQGNLKTPLNKAVLQKLLAESDRRSKM